MALLFPQSLPSRARLDPKLSGEVKVYDALAATPDKKWTGFYDFGWLGRRSYSGDARDDGQTDFVMVHKRFGIVLIEVKGGRIAYDGLRQTWTSTDRHGETHAIRPITQLRDAKAYLIEKIRGLPHFRNIWIPVYYAVCFPDSGIAPTDLLPSDTPRQIIIDGDELPQIEARLEQIAAFWRGNEPELDAAVGQRLVETLADTIAPTLELKNPLRLHLKGDQQQIVLLTQEQYQVLDMLSEVPRLAVHGCAGSGKTMLAAEKARRLGALGYSALLTCFHQPLAEELKTITQGMPNVRCGSFAEIARQFCRDAGVAFPVQADDEPDALVTALQKLPSPRYDALVVDEGQDFSTVHWIALQALLHDEQNGGISVFYDDNQRVHSDVAGRLPSRMVSIPLKKNVRNTQAIHAYLRSFYDAENFAVGPTGATVEPYPVNNEAERDKTLNKLLHRLLVVERIAPKDVVVLTPQPLTESRLKNRELAGGFVLKAVPSPSAPLDVRLSSIADFKGLEAPIVIIADMDEQLAAHGQRDAFCYVGLSRARLQMMLVGTPTLLEALAPPRDKR